MPTGSPTSLPRTRPMFNRWRKCLRYPATVICGPETTIQDLPVEILVLIFEAYVHELHGPGSYDWQPTYFSQGSNLSTQDFIVVNPFLLGHVDRHWRSISRSTPSLWSSVYITRPSPGSAKLVDAWLGYAKGASVSLHFSSVWGDKETEEVQAAAQVLDGFVSRYASWRSISISLNSTYQDPAILSSLSKFPNTHPPGLRTADIKFFFRDATYVAEGDRITQLIHSAPTLRHLRIYHEPEETPIERTIASFPNWIRLTSYTQTSYDSFPIPAVLALLNACPALTSLKIRFGHKHDAVPSHTHSPNHPSHHLHRASSPALTHHLQHLHLIAISDASPLFTLPSLHLPSLTSATLENYIYQSTSISLLLPSFLSLLDRSSTRLRDLAILGLVDDALLDLLASPQLRHTHTLAIDSYTDVERLFKFMTRDEDDPGSLRVLPCLESFTFRANIHREARDGTFAEWAAARDMVLSRTDPSLLQRALAAERERSRGGVSDDDDVPGPAHLGFLKHCSPGVKGLSDADYDVAWPRDYEFDAQSRGGGDGHGLRTVRCHVVPSYYWSPHPPSDEAMERWAHRALLLVAFVWAVWACCGDGEGRDWVRWVRSWVR